MPATTPSTKPSTKPSSSGAFSFLLFACGLFTVTWDLLGRRDLGGFHFKLHQGLFLLAFLTALPGANFAQTWSRLRASPYLLGFPLSILALAGYYMAASPWSVFPLKSFLYAAWLCFNMLTIWGSAVLLSGRIAAKHFTTVAWATAACNGLVIAVDHIAYRFGYKGGLIGFNQDAILHWGVSRPHAFASEPSYAAMFLSLALLLGTFAYVQARSWAQLAAGFLALTACIATTSRLGWSGLFLGNLLLCAIFFLGKRNLPWRYLAVSVLGTALAAGMVLASTPSQEREVLNSRLVSGVGQIATAGPGVDGSANARIESHKYAWIVARETHFLGTGLGASFKYWMNRPETVAEKHEFTQKDYGAELVMSTWGQLLAEGGIPAVLLYALAGFSLVAALWKAWLRSASPLVLGALSSAILFFGYLAFGVGNVARGDVWVWYALWSVMVSDPFGSAPASKSS